MRFRPARSAWSAALIAALLAPLGPAVATPTSGPTRGPTTERPERPSATAATTPAAGALHTVGLVTGDRVTVYETPSGRQSVEVELAERSGYEATYEIRSQAGQVYVIPSDAAPLVPRRLDPELFNVTQLVEHGFDLDRGVPVILTPAQRRDALDTVALDRLAGFDATATLGSIGGVAGTVDPGRPTWWTAVADRAGHQRTQLAGPLSEGAKVWLDQPVEAALDTSVAQVGAPEAWDLGFDGTGTTVAVLDTGIDESHPDLAGRIADARTFLPSGSASDGHGHGTHVAGIIAGDGEASDGDYTGVAPGARLLVGKVLDDGGSGLTSWIVDGMEWAATSGADVVNMSLGSSAPSNGRDPLSRTVDELTAQHGVLFVTAAGNLGPGSWTVASPGAADSALTVGAVDDHDGLARFSSRGPRLVPELRHLIGGEFAVKPDITAPGVGIIAPRATGTGMGSPVGARYTRASGTSMAAPHVAGAAALLLQQRPDLSAAELKAALVANAAPNGSLTVFQQGGGRLDIPAALERSVSTSAAPIDFGSFATPFPTEPEDRTVTFTNDGDAPASLDLTLDVDSPESGAATGLVVSPSRLELAPGESAQATVTLTPGSGSYGRYGGSLVATDSAGQVVSRVPTGYWLEAPTYTLTIHGIDRHGDPATGPLDDLSIIDAEDMNTFREDVSFYRSDDGTVTAEVPRGTYAVIGRFQDPDPDAGEELSIVPLPGVEVTADATLTLDARTANRVTVRTSDRPTSPLPHSEVLAGFAWQTESGQSFARAYDVDPTTPVYVAGAEATDTGTLTVFSRWLLGDDRRESSVYDLAFVERGEIPADLRYEVDDRDLAVVRNRYHSDVPDQVVHETRFVELPGWEGIEIGAPHEFNVPSERTDYYLPGEAGYRQRVNLSGAAQPTVFTPPTRYEAAQRWTQTWFARPMAPGLRPAEPTTRSWNTLRTAVSPWVDPGGHAFEGPVGFTFHRDGELVSQGEARARLALPMLGEPATYRLELRASASRSWWQTATSASTAWTWRSRTPADGGPDPEPLLQVSYDVDLDLTNTLSDRQPEIGLQVTHVPGTVGAPVDGARMWTSYDHGETWQRVWGSEPRDGSFRFDLDPRTADAVSLKVEAWDTGGGRIEQTVIDAFRLRPARTPAPSGTTVLASVASDGSQANRGSAAPPAVSADGRFIAFATTARNLVPGELAFPGGVFVRDLRTGRTERASFAANGEPADGNVPALSANGRFVAFSSFDDIAPEDTNGDADIYVYDRRTGDTEQVSVASDGTQGDQGTSSQRPAISADGRYVSFSSYSTNLVPNDTNTSQDVFVHDRWTGTTERVSVSSAGSETPRFSGSSAPALSWDGRYVTFESTGDNLVEGDTNNTTDIFVHDQRTGRTERVSVATDGTQAAGFATGPAIDATGRFVAFATAASNLVPGDTNGMADVYVHDRKTGRTERVSVATDGTQSDGYSGSPEISADGRYVGFPSGGTNLVAGDTNGEWDVYVHDRWRGVTERASVSYRGLEADDSSGAAPAFSADGDAIVFVSSASNLVRGDVNGESDVFVRSPGRR